MTSSPGLFRYMPPPDEAWLRNMVEAAQKAIAFCEGRTREDLNSDEMLRLALTKLVEIVGEAAKLISEPTRQSYPNVPWRAASRMRDRLVHHYFAIDLDILWSTITNDLPAMLEALGDRPAAAEWEQRVLEAPGAAERVSAIEEELRRAAGLPDADEPKASP